MLWVHLKKKRKLTFSYLLWLKPNCYSANRKVALQKDTTKNSAKDLHSVVNYSELKKKYLIALPKKPRGSGVFTECTVGKGTNLPISTLYNGHELHPSTWCQQVRTCFTDSRDTVSSPSLAVHGQSLITWLPTDFWPPDLSPLSCPITLLVVCSLCPYPEHEVRRLVSFPWKHAVNGLLSPRHY